MLGGHQGVALGKQAGRERAGVTLWPALPTRPVPPPGCPPGAWLGLHPTEQGPAGGRRQESNRAALDEDKLLGATFLEVDALP